MTAEVPHFDPVRLTAAMKARNISQLDLARGLHMHHSVVGSWETATAPIPAIRLRQVSTLLGCDPSFLQRPPEEPTLADLRTLRAWTRPELAQKLSIRVGRLACWENTGRLGTPAEHRNAVYLAAILGLSVTATSEYLLAEIIPDLIVLRFHRTLQVPPQVVRDAFERSRARVRTNRRTATPAGARS